MPWFALSISATAVSWNRGRFCFLFSAFVAGVVATPLAGFDRKAPFKLNGPIFKVIALDSDGPPQFPGCRIAIPARSRLAPAVLRCSTAASSMRRKGQSRRPNAATCSRFSPLKTFPIRQRLKPPSVQCLNATGVAAFGLQPRPRQAAKKSRLTPGVGKINCERRG
jgi:hypothetical protein